MDQRSRWERERGCVNGCGGYLAFTTEVELVMCVDRTGHSNQAGKETRQFGNFDQCLPRTRFPSRRFLDQLEHGLHLLFHLSNPLINLLLPNEILGDGVLIS